MTDSLFSAISNANRRVPDVTFLALIGRAEQPITLCMCADHLIPVTLYQGGDLAVALETLERAVATLERR
ncbi:hypothetical protein CCP2SC5_190042 [Azospirillaceae bacterium]